MTAAATCHRPRTPGGGLARAGRATLRADLTAPAQPVGCDCARCCPPPLTDIEAQRALRHVSDQDAVAYATGRVELVSCIDCPSCAAWVPTFHQTAAR